MKLCANDFQGKYVFGFIGTFGKWHGINILQRIIPLLITHKNTLHFLLIGDGILKQDLEDHFQQLGILSSVTFTGKIKQADAPYYLAFCDAYLCPTQPNPDGSRFFGSPTKLFEYMSMAKSIIASDLEQVGEIISPAFKITGATHVLPAVTTQVGCIVDAQDIPGFVRACELVSELSLHEQRVLGNNARDKVIAQYTWTQHVQKIIDHFHTHSEYKEKEP